MPLLRTSPRGSLNRSETALPHGRNPGDRARVSCRSTRPTELGTRGSTLSIFWRAATAMRAVLFCLLGFVATRTTGDRAFPARSQQSPHIVWFWSDDAGCWGIPFSSSARDALGATIVLDCDRN